MVATGSSSEAYATYRAARDLLLEHRADYASARKRFRWPSLQNFNWALDWFDVVARDASTGPRPALWIVEEGGEERRITFAEMARRSDQVAGWLRSLGIRRGDRVILMLGNQVELWETVLAAIKLGAVVIPSTTLLSPADIRDRVDRGGATAVIARSAEAELFDAVEGSYRRVAVGDPVAGWESYADSAGAEAVFEPDGPTAATDPMLLYFTSGTTAKPKIVEHSHVSYPVGHLSTMYWLGLQPGDVHLNISSPGWAKHAWSNVFAPWIGEATVFVYNYARFDAPAMMAAMERAGVTTFCAPPTVWRMLIQADLSALRTPPREAMGAGEPLNPEVIDQVRRGWGVTIRDGFGQTETTVLVANSPGQPVKAGSMGRAAPGFDIVLADLATGAHGPDVTEGEICVDLSSHPVGVMTSYADDAERTATAMRDGLYHTGDVASRDEDGYITYVGRADDVFKASDYRISPFELESVLLEHPAVVEAAVVPSPDPLRLAVPKAYVVLAPGIAPDRATAAAILQYAREHLAAYKRIRRLEFAELPKTISGKIRRVELRAREVELHTGDGVVSEEFVDADVLRDDG
jgi:acetyl-CoA synthetase